MLKTRNRASALMAQPLLIVLIKSSPTLTKATRNALRSLTLGSRRVKVFPLPGYEFDALERLVFWLRSKRACLIQRRPYFFVLLIRLKSWLASSGLVLFKILYCSIAPCLLPTVRKA